MRKMILLAALAAAVSAPAVAQVHVDGHYRKDGTYVQPHVRSSPNGTTSDNWSTRGNTNPHTGQPGTVNPDRSSLPSYERTRKRD